jgi:VIT1/CCC1 family predicted Fe2+/Mn2+ transporter
LVVLLCRRTNGGAQTVYLRARHATPFHHRRGPSRLDEGVDRGCLLTGVSGAEASIYVQRGLEPTLAEQVAVQLMAHDALGAHARDELGISAALTARPVQAALASAASFTAGAALPLVVIAVAPASLLGVAVAGGSLVFLAGLGALAARTGGAPVIASAWRVTFWGALAMALTAGIGGLFGAAVG